MRENMVRAFDAPQNPIGLLQRPDEFCAVHAQQLYPSIHTAGLVKLAHDIGDVKTASLFDAKFSRNSAQVLSSEGHGLSAAILPTLTGGLRIPMEAGVESLYVATAGVIVLYSIFGQQLSI